MCVCVFLLLKPGKRSSADPPDLCQWNDEMAQLKLNFPLIILQELADIEGSKPEPKESGSVPSDGEIQSADSPEELEAKETEENVTLSRQDTSQLNSLSESLSSSSLSMLHGTPIHKNTSGKRDSLPNPEKWRKDITEHIPFENLPGTTGNFERMNTLLDKVRQDRKSLTPKATSTPKT